MLKGKSATQSEECALIFLNKHQVIKPMSSDKD